LPAVIRRRAASKARRQGWGPRGLAKSALERDRGGGAGRASEVAQDRECLSVRSDLADVRRLVEQRPRVHRPLCSTAGPVESRELVVVERDLDGVLLAFMGYSNAIHRARAASHPAVVGSAEFWVGTLPLQHPSAWRESSLRLPVLDVLKEWKRIGGCSASASPPSSSG
jgi:hypothetical protein